MDKGTLIALAIIAGALWMSHNRPQSAPLQNEETWVWTDWNGKKRHMTVSRRLHD